MFSAAAAETLARVGDGEITAIASVITLTEVLVKPLQLGRLGLAARYEVLIRAIPNLSIVDVDGSIARRAALLRARHQLRTSDALHLASSREHWATAFVTNDARLRRIDEIRVIVLSEFAN